LFNFRTGTEHHSEGCAVRLGGSVVHQKTIEAEVLVVKNFDELEIDAGEKSRGQIVLFNYLFDNKWPRRS